MPDSAFREVAQSVDRPDKNLWKNGNQRKSELSCVNGTGEPKTVSGEEVALHNIHNAMCSAVLCVRGAQSARHRPVYMLRELAMAEGLVPLP